jgi:hypothetical protein
VTSVPGGDAQYTTPKPGDLSRNGSFLLRYGDSNPTSRQLRNWLLGSIASLKKDINALREGENVQMLQPNREHNCMFLGEMCEPRCVGASIRKTNIRANRYLVPRGRFRLPRVVTFADGVTLFFYTPLDWQRGYYDHATQSQRQLARRFLPVDG